MPVEQERFQKAVMDTLEAVMFENWLRFYFIMEKVQDQKEGEEPALYLMIPEKSMERIQAGWPHLHPMAEELNGLELTFERSHRAICTFIVEHLDGRVMARDAAPGILGSKEFQVRMQLFHNWVQSNEELLDRSFMDFDAWKDLFAKWCTDPAARELAEQLAAAAKNASTAPRG